MSKQYYLSIDTDTKQEALNLVKLYHFQIRKIHDSHKSYNGITTTVTITMLNTSEKVITMFVRKMAKENPDKIKYLSEAGITFDIDGNLERSS